MDDGLGCLLLGKKIPYTPFQSLSMKIEITRRSEKEEPEPGCHQGPSVNGPEG